MLTAKHRSNIRLTADIHFTTAKLLPLTVDGATTLGEFMENPRTATVLGQMMQQAFGDAASDENAGLQSDDATVQATMMAMPLKSLASFAAMLPEAYATIVLAVNEMGEEERLYHLTTESEYNGHVGDAVYIRYFGHDVHGRVQMDLPTDKNTP